MDRSKSGCATAFIVFLFIAVTAYVVGGGSWLHQRFDKPDPPPPVLKAPVAMRPTFLPARAKPYTAGTASLVRVEPGGPPLVLTTLHLLVMAREGDEQLWPGDVYRLAPEVQLTPFGGKEPTARGKKPPGLKGSFLSPSDPDVSRDVAAYHLTAYGPVAPVVFAPENPAPGEKVWLVGDTLDHQPQQQRLFPGRVTHVDATGTLVDFHEVLGEEGPRPEPGKPSRRPVGDFSGAPVLNARGEFVGLFVSSTGTMGIINPVETIRKRLAEAKERD